jgi:hypothetical protein
VLLGVIATLTIAGPGIYEFAGVRLKLRTGLSGGTRFTLVDAQAVWRVRGIRPIKCDDGSRASCVRVFGRQISFISLPYVRP